ncbi:exported hypothetical protein [uncultured delta proteobacterium]|uniref:Lipoprotein n=1 Tax=uncultured delta proteobacterium TaxID=34034 RepID=A0A212J676_9DELT|nr:exported hypothetical protein [uncultured delta proteobacterium]
MASLLSRATSGICKKKVIIGLALLLHSGCAALSPAWKWFPQP